MSRVASVQGYRWLVAVERIFFKEHDFVNSLNKREVRCLPAKPTPSSLWSRGSPTKPAMNMPHRHLDYSACSSPFSVWLVSGDRTIVGQVACHPPFYLSIFLPTNNYFRVDLSKLAAAARFCRWNLANYAPGASHSRWDLAIFTPVACNFYGSLSIFAPLAFIFA